MRSYLGVSLEEVAGGLHHYFIDSVLGGNLLLIVLDTVRDVRLLKTQVEATCLRDSGPRLRI